MAEHGVHRVDQLAPGDDVADAAFRIVGGRAPARGAPAQAGRADAAERERHPERAGAGLEERQVEAVQVVVLDDVGIRGADARDQARDEVGLGGRVVAARLEDVDRAGVIAHGGDEDAIARRVEAGGLEIELQAVHGVEREAAEVRPSRDDEVLLLGRQQQHRAIAELADVTDRAAEPARRAVDDRRRHRRELVRADDEAQGARPGELAVGDARAGVALGAEPVAEVLEIVEAIEDEPRPEPDLVAHELAAGGDASPHRRAAIAIRPHRDDARRRVPAREELVLDHDPVAILCRRAASISVGASPRSAPSAPA